MIYCADEERAVAARIDLHDREGKLFKRLRDSGLEDHRGHLRWSRREMPDLRRYHRTALRDDSREIDQGLSDGRFSEPFLERGR